MNNLTPEQIQAIKCAHADLIGAKQNYENGTYSQHDWKAHQLSILDLEYNFPDILTETEDEQTD